MAWLPLSWPFWQDAAVHEALDVPVLSLHLVTRYSGASPEDAPLHRLGTDQWDKAKKKAAAKMVCGSDTMSAEVCRL